MTHDIPFKTHLTILLSLAHNDTKKYPAKRHARSVAQRLKASEGLIYLAGQASVLLPDSDQTIQFRQLRYFSYLSGVCDETNCHLTYNTKEDILTLYVPDLIPWAVQWFGPSLTIEDAASRYDVDEVRYASSLDRDIEKWAKSTGLDSTIYFLHPGYPHALALPSTECGKGPRVDYENLLPAMDGCRVIKDEDEIALIRKANQVTAHAHTEVLLNLHKFENERQVQATFLDACISKGAKNQAYDVIAGSGENASILHYFKNDEPLQGRKLLCLDAGCEWMCYASDVTRTVPISGHWPDHESKMIYDLVQAMQTACITRIKAGTSYFGLFLLANEVMIEGLKGLGIFKEVPASYIYKSGAARIFFPHGLGHHMGLEVHDKGPLGIPKLSSSPINIEEQLKSLDVRFALDDVQSTPPPPNRKEILQPKTSIPQSAALSNPCSLESPLLEAGMVLTVEPGIYFSRYVLDNMISPELENYINMNVARKYLSVGGVRIEDDVLVTDSGCEILSKAPKGEEALGIIRSGKGRI